ncbi:nuclear transport factor 2 family protein [Rhizobium ruizarguesonis]
MMGTEDIIRDLVVKKGQALVERNALKLDEIIHSSFVYLNAGGRLFDKAGYIGTYCTSSSLVFLDQTLVELAVKPVDDFLVATMVLSDRLAIDGHEHLGRVRSMCVFTEATGKWLWAAGQTMSES